MLRQLQIFISALFAILIVTARADAIDRTDASRLRNLVREYLQLEQDILDVQKDAAGAGRLYDCLNELGSSVGEIDTRIDFLNTMATIASSMVYKSDEQTVLEHLNDEAQFFLKHLENKRKTVNWLVGTCSSNVVAAKAQEALTLFTKANSLVVGSMLPEATAAAR
jgi:hypothetical protein